MKSLLLALLLVSSSFILPSGAAQDLRPLPDAETLYKAVRGNLARAERDTYRYAYKERRTDVHANPFGRLGTGGTRVLEVYPSATPRMTYRRLIERNGTPLTAQELADEDRQYRMRVADVQRRMTQESGDDRRRREQDREQARQRGQRRIDDVLNTLEFKIAGRTVHNGVQAIVISFAAKPEAEPSTRAGRIAQKFAGTVWVDEAAAEVMQVEATSTDDLSFGFGVVARLTEGTKATLTRRPVEGGVWMPTRMTLNGRGRAALFRRLVIDLVNEWFDYRRLPDDSPTPFLDAQ